MKMINIYDYINLIEIQRKQGHFVGWLGFTASSSASVHLVICSSGHLLSISINISISISISISSSAYMFICSSANLSIIITSSSYNVHLLIC